MAKIGIISFAHLHAHGYAASINALDNADLVAIWDDDAKRGRAAAKKYNCKFVADLQKFLAMDLDGVIVTSENTNHKKHVLAAAKAGKWILCEKPLSPKVEDAKEMIAACKKAKVGLGTAFPCRYIPALIEARDRLQAGEFGEILAVHCTNHGVYPGGWFSEKKLSGGGGTMDHTVHVADLLHWMLGKKIQKVYCELGNQMHKKDFRVDDMASMHFEIEGGIQASHLASWSRPKSYPTWGDVTFEFVGTGGVLTLDAFNQKIDVYSDEAMKAEWAFWGANCDTGLVNDFVDAIHKKRNPKITGKDGLYATKVTVAAYKSAKAKRMVRV